MADNKKIEAEIEEAAATAEAKGPSPTDTPTRELESQTTMNKEKHEKLVERIGWKTIGFLIGTFIVEVCAMGFLGYLWYGTVKNKVWHEIVVREWVIKSITLTSLALRAAIATQGALCLSMLAAITLEAIAVPVENVATISLMRAGNKTDLLSVLSGFIWPMITHQKVQKRFRGYMLVLIICMLSTILLSQFASTALVSDLSIQMIAGKTDTRMLTYDYKFTNATKDPNTLYPRQFLLNNEQEQTTYGYTYPPLDSISLWQSKTPIQWPAFAEYAEEPEKEEGISDTGMSLRAFLPFPTANDRETVKSYAGKALVFDSRVTCQKPDITITNWKKIGANPINAQFGFFGTLRGTVRATKKSPRKNEAKSMWQNGVEYKGSALESLIKNTTFECTVYLTYLGDITWSICELPPTFDNPTGTAIGSYSSYPVGGLNSMFREESGNMTGSSFLILTQADGQDWTKEKRPPVNPGVPLDTKDSAYAKIPHDLEGGEIPISNWAMTLCYASYDVATRHIEADSSSNRTEPTAKWDQKSSTLNLTDVIRQLDTGYLTSDSKNRPTPEQRGVLRLKAKKDWTEKSNEIDIAGPDQLPYVKGGVRDQIAKKDLWSEVADLTSAWWDDFMGVKNSTVKAPETLVQPMLTPYVIKSMNVQGGIPIQDKAGSVNSWTAVMATNLTFDTNGMTGNVDTLSADDLVMQAVTTQGWVPALFNSMKEEPALALQAILTSLAGMAYYDRMAQYNKEDTMSPVFYMPLQSPGGPYGAKRTRPAKGLMGVLILLCIHLVLVLIIIWRFARKSHFSRIGDGWQAVAHLALSAENRDIMQTAGTHGRGGRRAVDEVIKRDGKMLVRVQTIDGSVKFVKADATT